MTFPSMAGRTRIRWLPVATCLFRSIAVLALAMPATPQEIPAKPTPGQQEAAPSSSAPAASPSTPPSDLPRSTLAEAMDLARKGDFAAAIKKYQQLLQEKPASPDGYAGLTRCYLKTRNPTQAYETVTKALQANDSWPVRVALGEVYFRQGKISEAEKEWVNVINSRHPAARAYLGLARVRWAIGMNKSAKTMIDKAHELDPSDPDIQRDWIGTLPRSEKIKYYESYLADPQNSDATERARTQSYLSYLQDRAKQPNRPCRLVSKVTNTQTHLVRLMSDPQHLRGYGLSVQLNGTRTNIMLDTGASGITIKRSTAERAGIAKVAETKIWGVGDQGPRNAYIGMANSIRIGELEFQNCSVEVVESGSLVGEDGLIGADVFHSFLVEVDFPHEKLTLSELPKRPGESNPQLALQNDEDSDEQSKDQQTSDESAANPNAKETASKPSSSGPQDRYIAPEMQSFTHVYRFGHQLLVPTWVGAVPGNLFLLDSGSLTSLISPAAAREVTKVSGDSEMKLKGVSGSVNNVFSAERVVLQVGNVRQPNQELTAFDTTSISENIGTEVSGFLGFTMLRFLDIKIDYRDSLVGFSLGDR